MLVCMQLPAAVNAAAAAAVAENAATCWCAHRYLLRFLLLSVVVKAAANT